jgi:hypothetical protein
MIEQHLHPPPRAACPGGRGVEPKKKRRGPGASEAACTGHDVFVCQPCTTVGTVVVLQRQMQALRQLITAKLKPLNQLELI